MRAQEKTQPDGTIEKYKTSLLDKVICRKKAKAF
jgi:hypothetical protein